MIARAALLAGAVGALLACAPSRTDRPAGRSAATRDPFAVVAETPAPALTDAETAEVRAAWSLYLVRDPRWVEAREALLARGPGFAVAVAELLLARFVQATVANDLRELERIGLEAKRVGAPAAAYFAALLAIDRRTPKDGGPPFVNDDVTRRHCREVLVRIGEPALRYLVREEFAGHSNPNVRRHVLHALGEMGDARALPVLEAAARSDDWQTRAVAAQALGRVGGEPAHAILERLRADPDPFVRRKAEDALSRGDR